MAIHGKQLKNASIDLSKLEGISVSPDVNKLLLSDANGAAQLLSVGGDLQASVSGTTLDLQIVDGTVTFTNLTEAAVIIQSEGILNNSNDTTLATSAAVKDYVDAQVSASGSALELSAGTGSASIALATETLSIVGGANISTVASSTLNSLTVSLDSHINLTSATLSGALSVGTDAIIGGTLTVNGNLTVSGTTTTIDTQNLIVEDHNIILGSVANPTDSSANGGGITLKGLTDKLFYYNSLTGGWQSSEHISVATGKFYQIGNTSVLTSDGAAKVQPGVAGVGLAHSVGVLSLDLNELASAAVDVANDSIAIIDATDSTSKQQTISGLATAMAGTGITATNGVLSVTSPELNIVSISPDATTGGGAGNLINVSGSSYALPSTPSGKVHLFVNGIAQELGGSPGSGDYYITSSYKIEWNSSDFDLEATDKIIISYVPA